MFPGARHVPIATLPGMAERTLTISSGGKTFNTTGWKIGWLCGPPALVTAAKTAKQFLTYVSGAPFQPAIAAGLRLDDDYFAGIATDLAAKRDRLVDGLRAAGFTTFVPEATYFTTVDIRPIQPDGDGMAFCRSLPARCGVVGIPNEVFYARTRARPAPRPLRLLQALRGARRGGVPTGDAGVTAQLRIAAVQHDIVWNDRDANFERLAPMVRSAAGCRRRARAAHRDVLDRLRHRRHRRRRARGRPVVHVPRRPGPRARRVGRRLVPGDPARRAARRPAARTTASCSPAPTARVHRYRKIHPFSFGGEEKYFRPGTDFVTVDVEGLRVSLFVCYDLRFADEFWQLAHDTDVFLVPANWPAKRRLAWTTLLQARAIENQAYVVGVNRVGDGNGIAYTGDSRIVDPLGELLATAAHTESILLADVSAATVRSTRDHFPFLQDRR